MEKDTIERIFTIFEAHNPNPKTELDHTNPYTLLVAAILSAQCTDKAVNACTPFLFEHVKTPEDMVAFGQERLEHAVKHLGLFRTKSKAILALSQILIAQHGGKVPQTREDLVALPGVGPKTANLILSVAFGQIALPVDTHVFRVANRLGLSSGKTPGAVEKDLMATIPERFLSRAHHWLVLHGRHVCKARKPLCETCVLKDVCPFFKKSPLVL